jgi:23S rRNA (adenine2503-C2)-methyltransferase
MATELLGKSKSQLRVFCGGLGEPAYRGAQIYHALYAERKCDFENMTNLPAALRKRLASEARITLPAVRQRYASRDGSVRYLFGLANPKDKDFITEGVRDTEKGHRQSPRRIASASVEAVFMPSDARQTICISTQAGCAVDCQFCLTAQLGLIRNLTAGEILGQVLVALGEPRLDREYPELELNHAADDNEVRRTKAVAGDAGESRLAAAPAAKQTNVVLMGQGEPLLNFEAVMAALRILLDPEGVGISPKHVTLSTSGIVPGIERLGQESVRPKLAISLNASNDHQRDALMPINRKYPLAALLTACKSYPLRPWEHLTFEYVMLGGINDSPEDARRVLRLLAPLKSVKVNLIPWNPGELPYCESSPETIEEFRKILVDRGVPAFVRYSRGRDVMAACGQLALKEFNRSPLAVLG